MLKLIFGWIIGLIMGVALTLYFQEAYYKYRENHGPIFSKQTVEDVKETVRDWVE